MTLRKRISLCQKQIERMQAERIGLTQAMLGKPLTRKHFSNVHEWEGYETGWTEGRAIIEKGEGL